MKFIYFMVKTDFRWDILIKDAKISEKKLGVSSEYSRSKYDNPTKRKEFKNEYFNGYKVKRDYYTGETVHFSSKAAKAKYGAKNYTKHSADVDHIIPQKKVYDSLRNNPFLSDCDVNRIANDSSNYRMTTSKFNRQKRDSSNLKMAFDNEADFSLSARGKMMFDHTKANHVYRVNVTKTTLTNASNEFIEGARCGVQDAIIPLVVSSVNYMILVANDEKELDEAVKELSKLTGTVALTGGATKVLTTGTQRLILSSGNQVFKKIMDSNQVTQIVAASLLVKDTIFQLINGDIDDQEFLEQVGKQGAMMIAGTVGAAAGSLLIPIPVVGSMVGSIITSIVCGEVFNTLKSLKEHEKKADAVTKLASEALAEMERQRKKLEQIIETELKAFDESITKGFYQLSEALKINDMELFANGLNTILSNFDRTVLFENLQEFNDFFDNDELELVL